MQMSHSHLTSRRGFTLAEMVVALLLFSLIGGGILTIVMRQQRFYRSTAEIIQLQGQLRQGASVLPLDLRSISTSDTTANGIVAGKAVNRNADVYGRSDWYMEFRRIFGSSVMCRRRTVAQGWNDTIRLAPKTLLSGAALTTWGIAPVAGDSLLILDEEKGVGSGDDVWRAYEIKAIAEVKGIHGCPWKVTGPPLDSTPTLLWQDTVQFSYKITLDRALTPNVMVGAPVRIFRRVRYEAYQAPDELWYLGYSDCLRTYATWNKCSEVTPLSGPYMPYTGIATSSGLVFTYYDSLGNKLATTAESRLISRIDVVMRSQSANMVTRTGAGAGEQYRDSLVLSIGVRNRR
jgi:prepilin-type N-terminal cleavage/methylation domain-containing protein